MTEGHKKNQLGSFLPTDVTLLLQDVTGKVKEQPTEVREQEIQNGRHYSEDLPIERLPSQEYMEVFFRLMEQGRQRVALYTGALTRLVLCRYQKPVLVSLVRAGVPCGVLMRRYAQQELGVDLPHYGISIIRGKGFDENALLTILRRHPQSPLVFVDGWTGKGMITRQLEQSCAAFNQRHQTEVKPVLAVLADPAHSTDLYATREDFINPSCCLNSTICGLISRTVHNQELVGPGDYHGVRVYWEFAPFDLTQRYLQEITDCFAPMRQEIETLFAQLQTENRTPDWLGMQAVHQIGRTFGIEEINRIKPSIGETTRVLLRRVPDRILVRQKDHPDLGHILLLAQEKGVPVEEYRDMPYLCCGLISNKRRAED